MEESSHKILKLKWDLLMVLLLLLQLMHLLRLSSNVNIVQVSGTGFQKVTDGNRFPLHRVKDFGEGDHDPGKEPVGDQSRDHAGSLIQVKEGSINEEDQVDRHADAEDEADGKIFLPNPEQSRNGCDPTVDYGRDPKGENLFRVFVICLLQLTHP